MKKMSGKTFLVAALMSVTLVACNQPEETTPETANAITPANTAPTTSPTINSSDHPDTKDNDVAPSSSEMSTPDLNNPMDDGGNAADIDQSLNETQEAVAEAIHTAKTQNAESR